MFPARRNVYNPNWATKLEKALPLLCSTENEIHKSLFVCQAVLNANAEGSEGLCAEIEKRLYPHQTFTSWLYGQVSERPVFVERQKMRKAWILDMIEEFSTQPSEVKNVSSTT